MIMQCEEPDLLDPLMQAFEWVLIKRFDIIRLERNQNFAPPPLDPSLEFGLYYDAEVVRVATLPPLLEKALSMRPSMPPEKIVKILIAEGQVIDVEPQKALPPPEDRNGCREGGYL